MFDMLMQVFQPNAYAAMQELRERKRSISRLESGDPPHHGPDPADIDGHPVLTSWYTVASTAMPLRGEPL